MIKNLIVDLGHGGINPEGNYVTAPSKMHEFEDGEVAYEGEINREFGEEVKKIFRRFEPWLNVVFTVDPEDYRDISLRERVRITNNYNKDETIFISIHCNAGGGTGFEAYTTTGVTNSDRLAEYIYDSVECLYEESNLGLREDLTDGDRDKEVDFYVIRKTYCPAVLLELGFFDNKKDLKFLKSKDFQIDVADCIYSGVMNYIIKENLK